MRRETEFTSVITHMHKTYLQKMNSYKQEIFLHMVRAALGTSVVVGGVWS